MQWLWLACIAAWLIVAPAIGGCGGGGADVRSDIHSTTVGQELMDLQRAHNSGVISTAEYEKQRQKILDRK